MKRIQLATVVALALSSSLASRPAARGVFNQALVRLRRHSRGGLARVKRAIDGWVACMLERRERQTTAFALRRMNDRQLRDIGLRRDDPALIGRRPASPGTAAQGGLRSVAVSAENRRP